MRGNLVGPRAPRTRTIKLCSSDARSWDQTRPPLEEDNERAWREHRIGNIVKQSRLQELLFPKKYPSVKQLQEQHRELGALVTEVQQLFFVYGSTP